MYFEHNAGGFTCAWITDVGPKWTQHLVCWHDVIVKVLPGVQGSDFP